MSEWRKVHGTPYGTIRYSVARGLLCEAQNYRCCYCGAPLIPPDENRAVNSSNDATIEHIRARCWGGEDDWNNLAAACAGCNSARPRDMDAIIYWCKMQSGELPKRQWSVAISCRKEKWKTVEAFNANLPKVKAYWDLVAIPEGPKVEIAKKRKNAKKPPIHRAGKRASPAPNTDGLPTKIRPSLRPDTTGTVTISMADLCPALVTLAKSFR